MKLSIIVPVFNEALFLRRCLDSIILPEDVEAIIIDDGSTDGSSEICDEYKDRFRVIHQANSGVSAARNEGIKHSSGEFITFLDSDDRIFDGGIETMIEAIRQYGNKYELIQFNHYRQNSAGELTIRRKNAPGEFMAAKPPVLFCYVWNKIYKREFIEKHKITFIPGMNYGEDEIFNLLCLYHTGKLMNYFEPVVVHHFDNSLSLAKTVTADGLIKMSEEIHQILKLKNKPQGFDSMIRQLLADVWNSNTYKRIFNG